MNLSSAWAVTVSVRVTGSSNDAEEQNPNNNSVYLNSTDLELVYDGGTRQFVGMRFQSLSIPQGATINSAYIEFEVDETDSGVTNVIIYGEDTDDAGVFGNGANNISNRTRTSASVNWNIPPWTTVSSKQQTPDLSTIIQEIINRGGWNSGNDLAILIEPGAGCNSSACQRTAESVNGEAANAPLLVVDYTIGSGAACDTFRDEFTSNSYSLQAGTANWSTDWIETGDDNSSSGGDIRITGQSLLLEGDGAMGGRAAFGGDPSIEREANLSTYTSALLTFDYYETGNWEGNDDIEIHVSNDGGSSWTLIHTFTNDQGSTPQSFSQDISAYLSSNTRIAFVEKANSGNEDFFFDNVQIEACGSVAPAGPYAWFQLDEVTGTWNGTAGEVVDQTGNITGAFALATASGVDSVPAQVCNGVTVPANTSSGAQYGIDSSIDMDSDLGDTGTISFWYNSNADWNGGGDRMLVDASTTADNKYFFLALMNSGSLRFRLEDSNDADFQLDTAAQNFAAGSWHHIAITWDLPNDSMEVFIDGNSVGTNNGNTSGALGQLGSIYFGDNRSTYFPSGTANSADGLIDEIRIYQTTQTASEVDTDRQADINSTRACPFTPVAEWRFDECSYTGVAGEVIDSQGNYHATPFYNVNTNTPGTVGYYLDETSNRHQVRTQVGLPMTTTWTVSAWFRTPFITTQRYHVLGAMDGGGDLMFLDRNNNYRWGVYTPSGGVRNGNFRFGTLSNGWHHVVLVGNDQGANGQTLLYIDGAYVETVNLQAQGNLRYVGTSYDGANTASAQGFGTALDEFLIFDSILTPAEISAIYTNQLAGNNYNGIPRAAPSCNAVDHYAIAHGGVGVTCEAESITVSAHDASHAAVAPSNTTTITLSTSIANDGWALRSGNGIFTAPNQYTFDGTETAVEFWLTKTTATTAPHMDIDVTDGSASDPDDGGVEDAPLEFRDTAFRFYADGSYNSIGTQIAGKSSSAAPGNQVLTLRAVQTNTDSGACEARVTGPQTLQMAFECINPTTCKTNNGVTVIDSVIGGAGDTLADNPQGGPISYSNVDLTFDASGTASWSMNYLDAGQIRLHALLNIPASGNDPADSLSGISNTFTSKPAGLCVSSPDANADCVSGDASCSAFRRAGEDFNLAIKAVAWQSAGEVNTDFCAGNATTPNFQLSAITLGHNLVAPAAGVIGNAGVTSFDLVAADDGDHTVPDQSLSEVGVFTFTATPPAYFGETITASTSANIGRFYPDHFVLSDMQLTNRSDLVCVSGFTYMGENFEVSYDLTAMSVGGANITQNYTTASGFAKLDTPAELNYGAVDSSIPTDLSARLNSGSPTINFVSGVADDLTDTLSLSRLASGVDGPYSLSVGIAPTDDDGTLLNSYNLDVTGGGNDHGLIQTTTINYGRMVLENTFGSELISLNMPMQAEYFNGVNFITNTADVCSSFAINDLVLANNVEIGQTDGDIQVQAGQISVATIVNNPLSLGDAGLSFCPPGSPACTPTAGNDGYIDVLLDLSTLPYLQFDWNGDGVFDNNPSGRATFGIYRGNSNQIYYRQIYQ